MIGSRPAAHLSPATGVGSGTALHRRRLLAAGTVALASFIMPALSHAHDIPSPEYWVGRTFSSRAGPVTQAVISAWLYANPVSAEGHITNLVEAWTTAGVNDDISLVDVAPVPYVHEYTGELVSWVMVEGSDAVEWQGVGGAFLHVTEPGIVWAARVSGDGDVGELADWIVNLAAQFLDRQLISPLETGARSGGLWDLLPTTDDLPDSFILETEIANGNATNPEGTPVPTSGP